MRHVGRSKAGFYPTPMRVVQLLGQILKGPAPDVVYHRGQTYRNPLDAHVLDPTCGDGAPLAALAEILAQAPARIETYGVELDRKRAAVARKRLNVVATGDALGFVARGFSLLFLNPPYDDAGDGKRLEVEFLKHFGDALMPNGVLVYIIPESSLPLASSYLLSHFYVVEALRFPEPEYAAFRQVVVLARRRIEPVTVEPGRRVVAIWDLETYVNKIRTTYELPATQEPGNVRLEDHGLDPERFLSFAHTSPAWDTLATHTRGAEAPIKLPPLVPMSSEHLALLVAAGHLNGMVIPTPEGDLLLRGRVRKVIEELPPEEDGDRMVQTVRERYHAVIQALKLPGIELTEIQ